MLSRLEDEKREAAIRRYETLYDGEMRFVDHHIGLFARALEERGILDSTLIAITSDHGSGMGEHGFYSHWRSVYDEVSRVPLILRHPRLEPRRVVEPVQNRDLFPTIVALAGISEPVPASVFRSTDLLLDPRDPNAETIAEEYSSEAMDRFGAGLKKKADPDEYQMQRRRALHRTDFKYIRSEDGTEELYDIVAIRTSR